MKKLEKKIKNKNNILNFSFLNKEKWDFEIENENRKQKYLRKRKQIKQNSPITKNDCWFEFVVQTMNEVNQCENQNKLRFDWEIAVLL